MTCQVLSLISSCNLAHRMQKFKYKTGKHNDNKFIGVALIMHVTHVRKMQKKDIYS